MRCVAFAVVLLTGCGLNDLGSAELPEAGASGSGSGSASDDAALDPGPSSDNPAVLLDGGVIDDEAGATTPPAPPVTCKPKEAYCASTNTCVSSSCKSGDCPGSRSMCMTCGVTGTSPRAAVCSASPVCGASHCGCTVSNDCPQEYEVCAAGRCVYCGTAAGTIDKPCKGGKTCGPCGGFIYCHGRCGGGGPGPGPGGGGPGGGP